MPETAPGISLDELLAAKEARSARRMRMQAEYPGTSVSLSLNIPGAEKDSPRIRALFRHMLKRAGDLLPVIASRAAYEKAGPHAVMAVAGEAEAVKKIACGLEAEKDYCRLLDIDVYDGSGAAAALPGRSQGRRCFVCSDLAVACRREGRHSLPEIMAVAEKFFTSFDADMSRNISEPAAHYASLGLEAMLHEAAAAPSPGLVDPFHTGSHGDMDFFTFQRSSAALAFGLARCAEAGIRHAGDAKNVLPVLRAIGLEAEKDMLRATSGVNTQKGLLFSMGLTLGAAGLLVRNGEPVTPETLGAMLRKMTAGIVAREMGKGQPSTAGEKIYREFGISGVRGEMEAGLPAVLSAGLPTLEKALRKGEDCNRALIRTLLALMAEVEDTTILARSPRLESLRMVQEKARALLHAKVMDQALWRDALWKLDAELAAHNLSPGGSADLLALTWFMYRVKGSAPGHERRRTRTRTSALSPASK